MSISSASSATCFGDTRVDGSTDAAFASRAISPVHHFLAAAGLAMSDVALFVCNQSTGWFVDACRRALGLAEDRFVESFADVANINECALLYNLVRARDASRLKDGDVVLFYSPAAGFTRTAIVYRHREAAP